MNIESSDNNQLEQRKETLTSLAKKYLNADGQTDVEIYLQDGEIDHAAMYLLGTIDALWGKGRISDEEAKESYEKLGIDGDKAAQIRSASPTIKDFGKNK